jgi:predicted nuclease with TOPRIM domain
MDDKIFKNTFDAAITELSKMMKELEELDSRRDELNTRIAHVRNSVLALSPLVGEKPEDVKEKYLHLFPDLIPSDVGLTDAVRKVLQSYDRFLSPKLVRIALQKTGYDIDRYSNILASIHTILKRLVESGEVEPETSEGGTVYKWKRGTKMFKQGTGTTVHPTTSDLIKKLQESTDNLEKIIIESKGNKKK